MSDSPVIMWFRRDLRLQDNPALDLAVQKGKPLIGLFINEDVPEHRPMGGASKWWLDKSLRKLASDIEEIGGKLVLRSGDPLECLKAVCDESDARTVVWNRRYSGPERKTDERIKAALKDAGIEAMSCNGSLLTEPWTLKTGSGGYYKVFTPYWKALRACYEVPPALVAPKEMGGGNLHSENLDDWKLHPTRPDWSKGFNPRWTPGEDGARERLHDFLSEGLSDYGEARNRPDLDTSTSRLSPHLAFGEISPVTVWRVVRQAMEDGRRNINSGSAWTFLSEVAWREFSYVLLYHNPELATKNYNTDFDHMRWRNKDEDLKAWQRGMTGYPIVDAGMRQLWQTGWMHNRVRMVVASFLTKHLLIPWQQGEDWFWDTLVDADPASNAASWQWTAGSGADAAPYFRVFNPITQGEKFDVTGDYVREYVPEIAGLPDKYLFQPWEADPSTLRKSGIDYPKCYTKPIVEHKAGRQRALDAYDHLKEKRQDA